MSRSDDNVAYGKEYLARTDAFYIRLNNKEVTRMFERKLKFIIIAELPGELTCYVERIEDQ